MKRVILLLLMFAMTFSSLCDTPVPPARIEDPDQVAESALPLLTLIASCPSFSAFTDTPGAELLSEIIAFWNGDEIGNLLSALLVSYELPAEGLPDVYAEMIPTELTIESAIDSGLGTVKVSVAASQDFGFGYEFSFYADFYLLPDGAALFGARVERVVIPE